MAGRRSAASARAARSLKVQPWDSRARLRERTLPPYDALSDPNCDWVNSVPFKKKMFASLNQSTSASGLNSSGPAPSMLEMPALEQTALKAIDDREFHLSRLHDLLLAGIDFDADVRAQAKQLIWLREQTADELHALRLASVAVVEAVVRWRRRRKRKLEPFVWRSHNYLLKMLLDPYFLGLTDSIHDTVRDP